MENVRLVASDLDRTLLLEGGQIPPGLSDYVRRLNEEGIVFVPASGRPLATLKAMFNWPEADLAFISDNGAVVAHGGEILYHSVLSPEHYLAMVESTLRDTDGAPVLCGLERTYIHESFRADAESFEVYFKNIVYIDDFTAIDEDAVKYSVYFKREDAREAMEECFQPSFGGELAVTLGGPPWVDIMNRGISKGHGIEILGEKLGIDPSQMMAFGDTFNDVEMLQAVGHSYAVANAEQEIKDLANHLTASNEEFGVYRVLDDLLAKRGA
ncbi:HAD family hydrolase [Actinomyces minihominis]|uniref:HAD family hydrolase n=1 Tax=Actinomyces minihominis TaxID=2002838 RepID=UPI000C07924A|nr:HAD family hydrolase [Actinomyces minihominis]